MTKEELITKQQLEIEDLKKRVAELEAACKEAKQFLYRPQQWNIKCSEFPKVAMQDIIRANNALDAVAVYPIE